MKNKIIKFLLWIITFFEKEPPPAVTCFKTDEDKVILPDHLSGKIIAMRIEFEEPVLPARVMENLDGDSDIKNPLPDRDYTLYHEEFYE